VVQPVVSSLDYWLKAASQTATADDMSDTDPQTQGIFPQGAPMSEAWKFIKKFLVDGFLNPEREHRGLAAFRVETRSQRGTPESWQTCRAHGMMSPHLDSFYEPESCATCLRMFSEHVRLIRDTMRHGSPASRCL